MSEGMSDEEFERLETHWIRDGSRMAADELHAEARRARDEEAKLEKALREIVGARCKFIGASSEELVSIARAALDRPARVPHHPRTAVGEKR